jgi:uracil-DNA glycosylase
MPTRKKTVCTNPLEWARKRYPVTVETATDRNAAHWETALKMELRKAYLSGAVSVTLTSEAEGKPQKAFALDDYASTAHIVPPMGPVRPAIAFVGLHPSQVDAARGEPFSGPDGHCLVERYLRPLNIAKSEALLTYVTPALCDTPQDGIEWSGWVQEELQNRQPLVTVALGKGAKDALGELAEFVLPHPSAVRKSDDDEQLLRKLKAVQAHRAAITKAMASVRVSKTDNEKRIVYGVVLDPYQFDTQNDWVPANDIENSCHDFMEHARVIKLNHATPTEAVVVECFCWPYPSTDDYNKAMRNEPHKAFAAKFGSDIVHSGAWVLATKVYNPKVWADIKAGGLNAYSIGGVGVRSPVDTPRSPIPEVEFIEV